MADCCNNHTAPKDRISPSTVYYCPMECEGEKVYFVQGKRCPVCNMYLVPIEEKEEYKNLTPKYSKTNLPESFKDKKGEYFCPMFCEEDKTYPEDVGCPVCHMKLELIDDELLSKATFVEAEKKVEIDTDLNAGKFYCPMYCEGDKVYDSNVGCPVCGMDLAQIPDRSGKVVDKTIPTLTRKFLIGGVFTLLVFTLSMGGMFVDFPFSHQTQGYLELLFTLPVLFYSGWFIMKRGYNSFRLMNLNMFSLIALGVAAAFIFSIISLLFPNFLPAELRMHGNAPFYFESVSVILTLVVMGQLLEAKAHKKTGKAIEELMNLTPDIAHLVINDSEKDIELNEVKKGNILRVKPGERIPVDGKITEGNALIDESMMTGEPNSIEKQKGDDVKAGTINGNTSFLMSAEKVGNDTLLAKVIQLVNEASRSKSPIQKLADKVSNYFVPTVIGIAIITFILWKIFGGENGLTYAFVNALAVLIVACPCALGLATPMSLTVGIGKAAKNGILIKNAEALEVLKKVDVLVTDKTGTLTQGKPTLDEIKPLNDYSEKEILLLAASLNQNSEHPLSKALLKATNEGNLTLKKVTHFISILGKGIKGNIDNVEYYLGNLGLLKELNINPIDEQYTKAKTVSYLIKNNEIMGVLYFSDALKPTTKKAIDYLQNENIEVIMLTGDNESTAKEIAKQVGIKSYKAECLPQDKIEFIKKLQSKGKVVAMAGDGINDAPALAQADIGIAMETGTDIAIESAEITLLEGDIYGIAKAKKLSDALLKNIKQNLFFAFVYNIFGIPLAAGILYPTLGLLLTPMFAAVAMSFSSFSVIINALRLNTVNIK